MDILNFDTKYPLPHIKSIFIFIFLGTFFIFGCARAPIKSADQAMRLAKIPKSLSDDLNFTDFNKALKSNIAQLKKYRSEDFAIKFGPVEVVKEDYIKGLEELISALESDPTGQIFLEKIKSDYEFYEVYGNKEWGEVFLTSYYEPIINGRSKKKKPYTQPLYGVPKDLVNIQFAEFTKTFTELQPIQTIINDKSRDGLLRGRLVKGKFTQQNDTVVPYYSREEIESSPVLKGQAEVLCYVDPIDAFFLQIQGSGTVILEKGKELRVGFAAQNGHSYKAIGKVLFDVIPKEEMTAQRIVSHLRTLPPAEMQKILNQNPSYVFFQKLNGGALTNFGGEVVPGRTIATDNRYFPKGALAFLEYQKPLFADDSSEQVKTFKPSARFVLDQDTGGAIRGPHRVDLFWGRGDEAARVSGVMRNLGRLYYILPKKRNL